MQRSDKKGISHSCFYGDIANKTKMCKSDIPILEKLLKNLFAKAIT